MKKSLGHTVIIACTGFLLLGCQSAVPIDEVVYEDGQGWVGIRPFPHFIRLICHPIRLTESEVTVILSGLRIQNHSPSASGVSNTNRSRPVFTEKQISWLAPKIVQSLVQAIEEDYVLFRVYDEEQGPRRKTEGMLYASGEGYHVTLTHYRARILSAPEQAKSSTDKKKRRLGFSPPQAIQPEENLYQFFVYEPESHLGMIHLNPIRIFNLS